jgi:hypothetical protein
MVWDLLSNVTAIIMLIGILVGTLINPRVTHRISAEHSRKDLIFRKKLEYFENILGIIERNTKMYKHIIKRIEVSKSDKEIKKLVEEMKKRREHFLVMSSPLYFDIRKISETIIRFVRVEKEVFNRASLLETSKNKKASVEELKNLLEILKKRGSDILIEMRKELKK